jgi:hypothetical protein
MKEPLNRIPDQKRPESELCSSSTMRCQNCHRELTADEPVYRVATGHAVGSLCACCATQSPDAALFLDQRWRPPQRCCHCGRPVILNGRRRVPRYIACSDRCRQAARNTAQWEIAGLPNLRRDLFAQTY